MRMFQTCQLLRIIKRAIRQSNNVAQTDTFRILLKSTRNQTNLILKNLHVFQFAARVNQAILNLDFVNIKKKRIKWIRNDFHSPNDQILYIFANFKII